MCSQSASANKGQSKARSHVTIYLVELFSHVIIFCSTLLAFWFMKTFNEILFPESPLTEFMETYSHMIAVILYIIVLAEPIINRFRQIINYVKSNIRS